jgi:hydroxyacylglutathione hydrolase
VNDGAIKEPELDLDNFRKHTNEYTIVDIPNSSEEKEGRVFSGSLSIPLPELRDRTAEIPTDKPIVVHCAGGYWSAAASSLLRASLNGKAAVYDLGEPVKTFLKMSKNES